MVDIVPIVGWYNWTINGWYCTYCRTTSRLCSMDSSTHPGITDIKTIIKVIHQICRQPQLLSVATVWGLPHQLTYTFCSLMHIESKAATVLFIA